MPDSFPSEWQRAIVLMPHPDDPEAAMSSAVAKWTSSGRSVRYVLASRGEKGIAGMTPAEAGPLREREQRRAAAIVGVDELEFWDEPDGDIRNTVALRDRIAATLIRHQPDVVVTVYGEAEWAPGVPNQRDHIEFAKAVEQAYDTLAAPPRWLFASALKATHLEAVDDFIEAAVASVAAHQRYVEVLDPDTPVLEQARRQLARTTPRRDDFGGHRAAHFLVLRSRSGQGSESERRGT